MKIPRPIRNLVDSFERLPGIGPKTAQRLTFYLLHVPKEELDMFSKALIELRAGTAICSECKNIGESDPCEICQDPERDRGVLAVVETPLDVLALERAGYKGLYHVLHGVISPLNNIGPDDIYIQDLVGRLKGRRSSSRVDAKELLKGSVAEWNPISNEVSEVILATNTNMEGESTAMYIAKLISEPSSGISNLKVTRIARGLPVGGDLEYADDITLRRALDGRSDL